MSLTASRDESVITVPLDRQTKKITLKGLNRSYLLLFAGSSVSMLGTRVSTIAYPMLVLFLAKSPVIAGWAAFAATAPSVLAYIPAGALVDRWDARKAMLASEIGRGCAVGTVVVALALGGVGEWLVYPLIAIALLEETLEVISGLSERRLTAGLLGRDNASSVLGGNEARTHVMILVGRPIGGLLFGIAHIIPFAVDAFSFLCSIGSLLTVRGQEGRDSFLDDNKQKTNITSADILRGLRWVVRDKFARLACLLNAGATLVAQALILIFLTEADRMKLAFFTIGVVLASTGAGGAVGSLAAKKLRKWARGYWFRIQMISWLAVFLAISITITVPHSLRYLVVEMFLLGLSGAVGNVEIDKYLIDNSPTEMLARVASVNSLTDFCAFAIGPLFGGLLVQIIGAPYRAVLVLAGIVAVLVLLSMLMISTQRAGSHQPDLISIRD